jgi:hypothetical protein
MLHPIPNGDSRPFCFVSTSSHRHGLRTSCSASFHPWKSHHVTTRSHVSTCVTPQPLWRGLVVVIVIVPTYVAPLHKGNSLLSSSTCVVTPLTWWTGLCDTPTIAPYCPQQQLVWTCRSPHLGMAAHLWFQGLPLPAPRLAQFQGPKVQFIVIEDVGLLSTSCHRMLQFTIMLDIPV